MKKLQNLNKRSHEGEKKDSSDEEEPLDQQGNGGVTEFDAGARN